MKTRGIFFLRGRPASVRLNSPTDGSVPGWYLPLGERSAKGGVQLLHAYWRGRDADAFIQAHPGLKAGDCLELEIDRLRAVDAELCGDVTHCELAPERRPAQSNPFPQPDPDSRGPRVAINSVATSAQPTGAAA